MKTKKITKRQNELLSFINHMISISLFDKVETRFTSRKYLTIEVDDLNGNELRHIESLGFSSGRYRIISNGYKKIAIISI